jgi:hypothetical protein
MRTLQKYFLIPTFLFSGILLFFSFFYLVRLAEEKNNNFIKDKIRKQLQVLRDNGLLEFKGNGLYRKI